MSKDNQIYYVPSFDMYYKKINGMWHFYNDDGQWTPSACYEFDSSECYNDGYLPFSIVPYHPVDSLPEND